MKFCKLFSVLAASAFVSSLYTSNAYASSKVSTEGSTSMEYVIGALGESFNQVHSNINLTYSPTGSSAGISAAIEGRTDIGLSSRALKDDEAQVLNSKVLALDGIVLVVNRKNPVNDLTIEQIKDLFSAKITSWSQLGGDDNPVVLIGRESGSGTRDGFESVISNKGACKYRQELTSTGDVITTVSKNINAIGYASLASVSDKVKVLKVNGIEASEQSIKDGSYKLQRPFLLVTKKDKELSYEVKKFLDYALSLQAAPIIKTTGVIPVSN